MQVYGVGKNGGFFGLNNDLNVSVKYGDFCYIEPGTGKFVYQIPVSRPRGYKEGVFEFDETDHDFDEAPYYGKFKISVEGELKPNSDVDIEKALKAAMKSATQQYKGNSIFDGSDYKVVRNDANIKAGYFYLKFSPGMGFWIRPYVMYIFSKRYFYSIEGTFTEESIQKTDKVIGQFFKALKYIEDDVREKNKEIEKKREKERKNIKEPSFQLPTYSKNTFVDLEYISVPLPDGFEYVTCNHIPENDSKAESLLKDYEMVAASSDCKGKLNKYKDVILGFNVVEASESNIDQVIWDHVDDAIAGKIDLNLNGSKIKIVNGGEGYLIGYGKGNECGSKDEPYWCVYFVVIFLGDLQQICNFYFNSKRTTAKNYNQCIEDFCRGIKVDSKNVRLNQIDSFKNKFGEFAADNGKLDAVVVSQLYTKDVIFHNEDELSYDGKKTVVTGFQMNAELIYDYPEIVNNSQLFVRELYDLFTYVESNKKLKVAKTKMHKELFKATRGFPLTGSLIFELCAWHMILIVKEEINKYNVALDNNLVYGIPDAYSYIGEFIKTLREYNELYEDFEVVFASTINIDSPCDEIIKPVNGAADFESVKTLVVEGIRKEEGFSDIVKNNIISDPKDLESDVHAKVSLDSIKSSINDIDSFEISDDINVLRVFINDFEANWKNAVKESNDTIMSSKDAPITRSNDARIRKINENTENMINAYASKLQDVMKKLDEIGVNLQKNSASDDRIIEISDLISECFEKLHIKTSICVYKEEKDFKYTIDNEFSNLSRKWKRIYKALPSVKRRTINQALEDKQNELQSITAILNALYSKRDETTLNIDKQTDECNKMREEYDANESIISEKQEQFDKDVMDIENSISRSEDTLQKAIDSVKEKENEIKSKRTEYSSKIKTKKQYLKEIEKRLDELKNHRQILEQDSITKKSALDKAFLFKKGKRQQYEESVERLRLNDKEIQQCENDISYSASDIDKTEKEKEQAISFLNSELDELKNEKVQAKDNVDTFKKRKQSIESEFKILSRKSKDIKKELTELEKSLKTIKIEFKDIESSINEKENIKVSLEKDIESLNKELSEI